ncbi:hypothetical protein DSM104299_05496 [Baekduia alba]|uniref:winged helix-turn-helix transcriptional regulator n=1 Tax=Baekduia alba TaxID=2997333 RepID=UPI0023406FB8|nr:helix-turn-helix domain-containing protein [Baekduia alba]WCB96730.1 hypothetical protein DSM104299_05496 [Baekduia alba]
MLGNTYDHQQCSIARALEVVGERWTLLVVRDALYGVQRFSDFAERLDIPRAVLSDRLRSLVEHDVLERVPDPDHRGRSLYRLTARGRELWPVVHALASWGSPLAGGDRGHRQFRHAACDAQLDANGRCPTCGAMPAAEDVLTTWHGAAPPDDDSVSAILRRPHRLTEPVG